MDVVYDEEKLRVEEECRTGWMRVRERLLEGLEEKWRKAREEKGLVVVHPIRSLV
jgi:hypothetical protein